MIRKQGVKQMGSLNKTLQELNQNLEGMAASGNSELPQLPKKVKKLMEGINEADRRMRSRPSYVPVSDNMGKACTVMREKVAVELVKQLTRYTPLYEKSYGEITVTMNETDDKELKILLQKQLEQLNKVKTDLAQFNGVTEFSDVDMQALNAWLSENDQLLASVAEVKSYLQTDSSNATS